MTSGKILNLATALLMLALPLSGRAVPIVQFDPADSLVSSGSVFTVNVFADDMTDLYAYQFTVSFDPTLVAVDSVAEGDFLAGSGTTFFVPGEIDNTLGTVSFTGNSLLGDVSGATGSGTLATLGFRALSAGMSLLSFSDVLFLDSNLDVIDVGSSAGQVQVQVSVPEPGPLVLLAIGLAGLLVPAFRRRTGVG